VLGCEEGAGGGEGLAGGAAPGHCSEEIMSIEGASLFFLQLLQSLSIPMHAAQPLCDRVIGAILLLYHFFYPPDLGKKLADLLFDVVAVLLGHEFTSLQL